MLDSLASYFATILNDTFSAIVTPPDIHSSNSMAWRQGMEATFTHPANGTSDTQQSSVAANEYRIYAGARTSGVPPASAAPEVSAGAAIRAAGSRGRDRPNDAITETFSNQVEDREETSGFASWGGSSPSTAMVPPPGITTTRRRPTSTRPNFIRSSIHELTHAFGLWELRRGISIVLVSGSNISLGADRHGGVLPARFLFFGIGPLGISTRSSTVYGTSTAQEAAMDP